MSSHFSPERACQVLLQRHVSAPVPSDSARPGWFVKKDVHTSMVRQEIVISGGYLFPSVMQALSRIQICPTTNPNDTWLLQFGKHESAFDGYSKMKLDTADWLS